MEKLPHNTIEINTFSLSYNGKKFVFQILEQYVNNHIYLENTLVKIVFELTVLIPASDIIYLIDTSITSKLFTNTLLYGGDALDIYQYYNFHLVTPLLFLLRLRYRIYSFKLKNFTINNKILELFIFISNKL